MLQPHYARCGDCGAAQGGLHRDAAGVDFHQDDSARLAQLLSWLGAGGGILAHEEGEGGSQLRDGFMAAGLLPRLALAHLLDTCKHTDQELLYMALHTWGRFVLCASEEHKEAAAADAAKLGMHFKFVCEEIEIPVPKNVEIEIDATACEGFINNTGTIGQMKHIDLRQAWVQDLSNRDHLDIVRRDGSSNKADFFTKIIMGTQLRDAENYYLGTLD